MPKRAISIILFIVMLFACLAAFSLSSTQQETSEPPDLALVVAGPTPANPPTTQPSVPVGSVLTGVVVEYGTHKPIPNALVFVRKTHDYLSHPDVFSTRNFWKDFAALSLPINVTTAFSPEFIKAMRIETAGRTDNSAGYFLGLPDFPSEPSSGGLYMCVMAEGYMPSFVGYVWSPIRDKNKDGYVQIPPFELFPGTQVKIVLDLPEDVPQETEFDLFHIWPSTPYELRNLSPPQHFRGGSLTAMLPTGIPFSLYANTMAQPEPDAPYWTSLRWESGPIALKQGALTTINLKRVKYIPVTVTLQKPDGTPASGIPVCYLISIDPQRYWFRPGRTDESGKATLLLHPGRKTIIYFTEGSISDEDQDPRFSYTPPEDQPAGELNIKFSVRQWPFVSRHQSSL